MKYILNAVPAATVSALVVLFGTVAFAEPTATCGTWAAEDALGRKVAICESGVKPNKEAILFYWTWHDEEEGPGSKVKNITEIIRTVPGAMTTGNQPCWNNGASGGRFFWDEPLFGYYKTWDKWVLRKHAEMLAAAQVDAVFFDCTNGSLTWDKSTDALLETWDAARRQGVKVPRIGFMLPFAPVPHALVSLRHLYQRLYKPGKYRELWYCRGGKPCIMAYPDNLTPSAEDQEIKAFFTFRPGQPDYVNGPHRGDQWGWLENYPQHGYGKTSDGRPELVTAGVAQNACPASKGHCSAFNMPGSFGRSFTKRNGFDKRPDAHFWGANFAEQWDRVYELNPDAVFITGWNEWTAGIWYPRDHWMGKPFSFVDQFDWDHSRDCEPCKAWGDKGDVYYLMLVDRIRRFKGGAPTPKVSAPKTIRVAADWQDVAPLYPASKGNVFHRHSKGYGEKVYDDVSGRNDIVGAKVARDDEYVYFAVCTDQPLTPSTDRAWMTLFLDTDRSKSTGWNGYDLIVNRVAPSNGRAVVERADGKGWTWKTVESASFTVEDRLLVLRLPRTLFGERLDFEFKWGDNLKLEGDVMDFYVSGDVAPLGRFNYIYTASEVAARTPVEQTRARLLSSDTNEVFVVSHRALWRKGSENSLKAIEAAIQAGVDLVECDVRVTKDGVAVLSHDKTVDRCSNGKGNIGGLTLAQMKALRLREGLGGKDAKLTDETYPTFDEALKLGKDRVMFNVDETWGALDAALTCIETNKMERQVLVKCYGLPADVRKRFGEKRWAKVMSGEMLFMAMVRKPEEYKAWRQEKYVRFYEFLGYADDGQLATESGTASVLGVRTFCNTLWGKRSDEVSKKDPDKGWNWYLKRGITMLQSDDPEALIAWLRSRANRYFIPKVSGTNAVNTLEIEQHEETQVLLAKISVNGKTCRLLVDTGASHTVLDAEWVKKNLPKTKLLDDLLSVAERDDKESPRTFEVESVQLGKTTLVGFRLNVVPLPQLTEPFGGKVDGVLGADVLGYAPFVLSVPLKKLIWHPEGLARLPKVPLKSVRSRDGFGLDLQARVQDRTLGVRLSSGAGQTVLRKKDWPGKATPLAELMDDAKAAGPETKGIFVGEAHEFKLCDGIGLDGFTPVLDENAEESILGMDVLSSLEIMIDFREARVYAAVE